MRAVFRAGQRVLLTRVYEIVHAHEDVPTHYVTALSGDSFPACSERSDEVRFELALIALHFRAHPGARAAGTV